MYSWHSDRLADELVKAQVTEITKAELLAEARKFDRADETLVYVNAFADAVVIGFCSLLAWGALWLGVSLLLGL